jgi:hypothetical protein
VLANARLSQSTSCLARLTHEFPLLDPLLRDAGLEPDRHLPSPPLQPPHPSRIERLKWVYGGYWPVHEDPREMRMIVEGLRAGAGRPEHYLESVHEHYRQLGGWRSR